MGGTVAAATSSVCLAGDLDVDSRRLDVVPPVEVWVVIGVPVKIGSDLPDCVRR